MNRILTPTSARAAMNALIAQMGETALTQLRASYSVALPDNINDTDMQHFIDGIGLTSAILMLSLSRDPNAFIMALADPLQYAQQVLSNALALIASCGVPSAATDAPTDQPAPQKADIDALLGQLEREMRGE